MIPCRPNQQPQANAAAPRAVSGQHSSPSSPSSGAARASAGEALVWHFVCDEICDVLCGPLRGRCGRRGAGARLTASAASTLKAARGTPPRPWTRTRRRASAPRRVRGVAPSPRADLLEAAKDRKNMKGLRKSPRAAASAAVRNRGIRRLLCHHGAAGLPVLATSSARNTQPATRVWAGHKEKYPHGALARGNRWCLPNRCRVQARPQHRGPRPPARRGGCFRCSAGCARTFTYAPAAIQHGRFCRAGGAALPAAAPVSGRAIMVAPRPVALRAFRGTTVTVSGRRDYVRGSQ